MPGATCSGWIVRSWKENGPRVVGRYFDILRTSMTVGDNDNA